MSVTALRVVEAAAGYPVSLADAKENLRVSYPHEDKRIKSLIAAATDWAQAETRRVFMNTRVMIRMDRFPCASDSAELVGDPHGQWFYVRPDPSRKKSANKRSGSILLPGGNVSAINEIAYTDADGAPQTLTGPTSGTPGTDYQEDLTDDEWPFIYPPATGWPSVDSSAVNAVSIDYQAGWQDAAAIPQSIVQAIQFKVADMFTIRDTSDAGSKSDLLRVAEDLLSPYVVPRF